MSDVPVQIEAPNPVNANTDRSAVTECEPPDYPADEEVATRSGYGAGLAKLGSVNPDCGRLGRGH